VLAVELAEIEVLTETRGVRPLLLLDDVSSELDRTRTAALLKALCDHQGQVIVTTTRPELLESEGFARGLRGGADFVRFEVRAGGIEGRL